MFADKSEGIESTCARPPERWARLRGGTSQSGMDFNEYLNVLLCDASVLLYIFGIFLCFNYLVFDLLGRNFVCTDVSFNTFPGHTTFAFDIE